MKVGNALVTPQALRPFGRGITPCQRFLYADHYRHQTEEADPRFRNDESCEVPDEADSN